MYLILNYEIHKVFNNHCKRVLDTVQWSELIFRSRVRIHDCHLKSYISIAFSQVLTRGETKLLFQQFLDL